jgi:hypothetical protein
MWQEGVKKGGVKNEQVLCMGSLYPHGLSSLINKKIQIKKGSYVNYSIYM